MVSIKPAAAYPCSTGPGGWFKPGGRVSHPCILPLQLIVAAYEIKKADLQLLAVPAWVKSEAFDLEAKPAPGTAIPAGQETAVTRSMLQALLADRFHLQIVHEVRQLPVYNLVNIEPNTILKPAAPLPPSEAVPHAKLYSWPTGMQGAYVDMPSLIAILQPSSDRLIVDVTALAGRFDYQAGELLKDYTSGRSQPSPAGDSRGNAQEPATAEQMARWLGLRLVPAIGPVDVYIIQHIDEPDTNH